MFRRVASVVLAGVVAALCGCGGGTDETVQATGTFTIVDSSGFVREGGDCHGIGGFSDLGPSTAVVVEAADTGDRVARTDLGLGAERIQRGGVTVCEFEFSFEVSKSDDADGAGFVVNVGDRGGEQYSFESLRRNPDTIEMSIG